ncbi:MAG: hypothetical protein O7D32_02615, partial [bacterium]|nr:hypothetical protein [bacterium]
DDGEKGKKGDDEKKGKKGDDGEDAKKGKKGKGHDDDGEKDKKARRATSLVSRNRGWRRWGPPPPAASRARWG